MKLRMWMLDLAREQSPSYEWLQGWCRLSLEAGYNAIGLYLEHRFAYPSLPWVHGKGALEPEVVQRLQEEFPDLQIIPFINLLGHFEGFLYTEEGAQFAEETFAGMQASPLHPEFVALCRTIIDDTLATFSSEIVHIGGDETWQLGVGEASARRVREAETDGAKDGKAVLYGEHFGPLAQYVVDRGRRPAVWGDMFAAHPDALPLIPAETLIFDWQYFSGPRPPRSAHEKVYCPAIQTYNALWCHLPQSERNVVEHAAAAMRDEAYGVCVTTWEMGLFGNYNTLRPAIRASGEILTEVEARFAALSLSSVPPRRSGLMARIMEALAGQSVDTEPTMRMLAARELSLEIVAPYDPQPESSLDDVTITDPTGGLEDADVDYAPLIRLADAVIKILVTEGHARARFHVVRDWGHLDLLPGREGEVQIPPALVGRLARRLRLLASLPPQDPLVPGPGVIRGSIEGEEFEIELRSLAQGESPDVELSVLRSPRLVQNPASRVQYDVAEYSRTKDAPHFLKAYLHESETSEEWARLLGCELQEAGGLFAYSNIRSSIKARLLLYSNPFLLYLRNGDALFSESGEQALRTLERAATFATGPDERGPVQLGIKALEFVRQCRRSHLAYAEHKPGEAINHLAPCRQIFEDLEKIAVATSINADGSLADVERCRAARRHVELVIGRIKTYGDGSLGYLPSFATITHPKFIPHDQANWWLINRWANE